MSPLSPISLVPRAVGVDDGNLVFSANMFIVGLIGLAIIWRLPKAIARFSEPSVWKSGFLLRLVVARTNWTTHPALTVKPNQAFSKEGSSFSDYDRDDSQASFGVRSSRAATKPHYPRHVPAYWRILRPLSSTLQMRCLPGYTIDQVLVIFFYFCCLVYLPFYESNPFTDAPREGFIAAAQLPFVFLFSAKNNILGGLLGLGYERLNFLHRFVGRLVILLINLHVFHYTYRWSMAGIFQELISTPSNAWGMVGFVSVNLIFLFSSSFWRQRAYNIFRISHVVAFTLLIPACWYHQPSMRPYVIAVLVILAYDRTMRLVKSRFPVAILRSIPELNATRVEIPAVNAGWRPGQHIRLRVFSSAMGVLGWSEVHPFTISGVSESPEGMVLMCKKSGRWTSKLFEAAKIGGYSFANGALRKVRVQVEGPYGGGGHTIFTSFSGSMIVAAGSGITFALSVLQDMIQKDLTHQSRLKIIHFIWIVQDPTALSPLLPTFTALLDQARLTNLRISIFYTRAVAREIKLPYNLAHFPPNLTLTPGRPKLPKILESVVCRSVVLGAPGGKDDLGLTGILVACCGPKGLGDDCSQAISLIEPSRRDQVGGIELHEEKFGW